MFKDYTCWSSQQVFEGVKGGMTDYNNILCYHGERMYYWSSYAHSNSPERAACLRIEDYEMFPATIDSFRYNGLPVRCVMNY
jgi:uncharacterized protein (TIGR02145 family)